MAYAIWSVTAGEVPTSTKWNILGTNDAGFNDGTAMANAIILARHIAANVINSSHIDWTTTTPGGIWWQELGRVTLGSAAASMSTPTITGRKYLNIMSLCLPPAAAISPWIRFNNDTGNNYAMRYSANTSASATLGSQNGITMNPGSVQTIVQSLVEVTNIAAQEKPVTVTVSDTAAAGAANSPNTIFVGGKWANTSVQITSVQVFNSSGLNLAAGSELIVLGHD